MKIRDETASDVSAIAAVTEAAFAPYRSGTEQFIVSGLREAGVLTISLVAELDGVVVGHVAISPVSISDGSTGWFGLGPISVAPEHQRTGIGSGLMERALAELRERGAAGCVLLGDPAYYGRFGFRSRPELDYPGAPTGHFQVLPFGSTIPEGTVRYHEAFEAQAPR